MRIAVACASGSAKGVFVHGVLSAFTERSVPVDAYAASSSSTIPAAFAAAGRLAELDGAAHWQRVGEKLRELQDVAEMVKWGIAEVAPALRGSLFRADANLACHLFDTMAGAATKVLKEGNLADALYATTRMLHAWKAPGWIDGGAYIDASYTCMCPAVEVAELGYECVVAVSPETGPLYRDIYQARTIPPEWKGSRLLFIQPDIDLKEIGVDYLSAQPEGLRKAFDLGRTAGLRLADGDALTARGHQS